ncbi:hypothetical protein FK765_26755 [Escherichia coli]|nr:hypothetical protein [Escherichia coli]
MRMLMGRFDKWFADDANLASKESEPRQPEGYRGSQYTLVSGPDGPLTRRYAPTSGNPSSGPLRPRTEALS